jgi:hypothetical protein
MGAPNKKVDTLTAKVTRLLLSKDALRRARTLCAPLCLHGFLAFPAGRLLIDFEISALSS